MIIGICRECGEHEITSYDGPGCVNVHCSRCVLGPMNVLRHLLREDKKKKKLLNIMKESQMHNNQKEAIKLVKEARENLQRCEALLEKVTKPESYPCVTHIVNGDIVFNDGKQRLSVNRAGVYEVRGVSNYPGDSFNNHNNEYVWVPVKREDLKVGDTAYTKRFEDKFTNQPSVCKILSSNQYVYIADQEVRRAMDSDSINWYKLVKKEEVL